MFTAGKVVLSFFFLLFAKRKKQGLKVVFFSVVSLVGRLRVKVSSTANVQSAAAAAAGESFFGIAAAKQPNKIPPAAPTESYSERAAACTT